MGWQGFGTHVLPLILDYHLVFHVLVFKRLQGLAFLQAPNLSPLTVTLKHYRTLVNLCGSLKIEIRIARKDSDILTLFGSWFHRLSIQIHVKKRSGFGQGNTITGLSQRALYHLRKTYSTNIIPVTIIGYRCDNRRFWLSAHNCQVPTPTSQNLELEQQIRIF
jgi:hypothetical protein